MNPVEAIAGAAERGGNVYDKYASAHPIERRLVAGFLRELDQLVERTGAREAHEVGCGEGELSLRLAARGLRVRGGGFLAGGVGGAR
jgi:2-polyprenyl-3-methyl-5-hydroxy-6-metoxy-1,4-benzoquinol methylase